MIKHPRVRAVLQRPLVINNVVGLTSFLSVALVALTLLGAFVIQGQTSGLRERAAQDIVAAAEARQSRTTIARVQSDLRKSAAMISEACKIGSDPSIAILTILREVNNNRRIANLSKATIALHTPPPMTNNAATPAATQVQNPQSAATTSYDLTLTLNDQFPGIMATMRRLLHHPLAIGATQYTLDGQNQGAQILATIPVTIVVPTTAICTQGSLQ